MTAPPPALAARLEALGIDPASVRLDRWALEIGDVARAFAADVIVEVALTARGRDDLALERRGRAWAAGNGVRTPRVLDAGADWMVGELWPAGRSAGAEFVTEAVAAATRIQAAPASSWMLTDGDRWRAPARGRLRRIARQVRSGLPLREFARVRRIAAELPRPTVAHGDYHPGNLLFDERAGRLAVIDWTHAGPAPRHTDLVRLWGQLPSDDDSAALIEAVLRTTPRAGRPDLGALWHWLALRQLAEHLDDPTGSDDPGYPAQLARRLAAARELARDLGSPTAAA
jgi:Phosphotransferase enzyme family